MPGHSQPRDPGLQVQGGGGWGTLGLEWGVPGWGSCCWMWARGVQALIPSLCCLHPRWAKGGFLIEDAHESRYETNVDYSFFTEPVSCEVHNKVGSTNVSTLVNVHCE